MLSDVSSDEVVLTVNKPQTKLYLSRRYSFSLSDCVAPVWLLLFAHHLVNILWWIFTWAFEPEPCWILQKRYFTQLLLNFATGSVFPAYVESTRTTTNKILKVKTVIWVPYELVKAFWLHEHKGGGRKLFLGATVYCEKNKGGPLQKSHRIPKIKRVLPPLSPKPLSLQNQTPPCMWCILIYSNLHLVCIFWQWMVICLVCTWWKF